ncbi:MAG: hypothetical protein PVSMB5_19950 [Ktedonobacteraceae bacterium]
MSSDVHGIVTRDGAQIFPKVTFQIERMSEMEASAHGGQSPYYLYNGFCLGAYDLRQNDYIVDLYNVDPVTNQPKAYQIINEPESFPDQHMEFQCARANRAMLTRGM